jgi:hypothetical protein
MYDIHESFHRDVLDFCSLASWFSFLRVSSGDVLFAGAAFKVRVVGSRWPLRIINLASFSYGFYYHNLEKDCVRIRLRLLEYPKLPAIVALVGVKNNLIFTLHDVVKRPSSETRCEEIVFDAADSDYFLVRAAFLASSEDSHEGYDQIVNRLL